MADLIDLLPHGRVCLAGYPALVLGHLAADLALALSYAGIGAGLMWHGRHFKSGLLPTIRWLFGVFILLCGATHLMSAVTLYSPVYWWSLYAKGLAAAVSVAAAVFLIIKRKALLKIVSMVDVR